MARITTEDCKKFVGNKFDLVLLSAHRVRQMLVGTSMLHNTSNDNTNRDKNTVLALREIGAGAVDVDALKDHLVMSFRQCIPAQSEIEEDLDDDEEDTYDPYLALASLEDSMEDISDIDDEDDEEDSDMIALDEDGKPVICESFCDEDGEICEYAADEEDSEEKKLEENAFLGVDTNDDNCYDEDDSLENDF